MSSAKNHARRSRRGFAIQKSITGGMEAKTWIKTAEKKRRGGGAPPRSAFATDTR